MKSKETVENLLKSIKFATGLTQEQIADKIKYQREYLSQAKKTNSPKLISLLKSVFKEDLQKVNIEDLPGSDEDHGDLDIIVLLNDLRSNLNDTKQNVLLNQAIGRAQLRFLATLEAQKHEHSEEKMLEIVRAQSRDIDDILVAIHQARNEARKNSKSLKEVE